MLCSKKTRWCLGNYLADYRCATRKSSGCYVRSHNENHQTIGPSSSLEELTKGHPIAFFPARALYQIPSWQTVDALSSTSSCMRMRSHTALYRYHAGTDCLSTRADSVMYLYHRQWHGGTGINNSVF